MAAAAIASKGHSLLQEPWSPPDARRPAGTGTAAPTCDPVLDLPLHLQGVHVDGPVPDEARAGDAPVRLAEPVLVVVVSGETRSW